MTDSVHDKPSLSSSSEGQCQFFVVRKKRLCRMTVRPGRGYCGEHEPRPPPDACDQADTRIPCPYDSKHTCYASKLERHLVICNARRGDDPPYIERDVNAPPPPPPGARSPPRLPLGQVSKETLARVLDKVNSLYEKHLKGNIEQIPEQPIHEVVVQEFSETDRAESSRRHLRQVSSLLRLAEGERMVGPGTCYVELGAGKGHLSYYACSAWCKDEPETDPSGVPCPRSSVLLVDRASLRHKRDNRLRARCTRLRADLAHVALGRVPAVRDARALVALAKHLCGVATDYALRCVTSPGAVARARGLVLATCCHHRCDPHAYVGREHLRALGITSEEFNVILGIVSWATCGDGRSRERRRPPDPSGSRDQSCEHEDRDCERDVTNDGGFEVPNTGDQVAETTEALPQEVRALSGWRAKALVDWGRVRYLRERGFAARLARFVPARVSPENLCIVATRGTAQ